MTGGLLIGRQVSVLCSQDLFVPGREVGQETVHWTGPGLGIARNLLRGERGRLTCLQPGPKNHQQDPREGEEGDVDEGSDSEKDDEHEDADHEKAEEDHVGEEKPPPIGFETNQGQQFQNEGDERLHQQEEGHNLQVLGPCEILR